MGDAALFYRGFWRKLYKNLKKYTLQIEIVRKALVMIKQNVNLELLLDYFVIEMRKLNEWNLSSISWR